MLATVDPAVGFGASTRTILLRSCDIAGCQSITLWQNRPSDLELDDIARGFSYHCGSASDTLAQFRGLAISLRAPSGDYLIANSPFRHLQEPRHDAAPLPGRNQEVSADSCDGPLDFMDAFALATDERHRALRVNFRPKCDSASNFDPTPIRR